MRLFRKKSSDHVIDPQLTALRQEDDVISIIDAVSPAAATGTGNRAGSGNNEFDTCSVTESFVSRASSMPVGTPKIIKKSGMYKIFTLSSNL